MQKEEVDLPIGLGRLISSPDYLALFTAINGDDLTMDMTAEVVTGKGQDGHGDSLDGGWFS